MGPTRPTYHAEAETGDQLRGRRADLRAERRRLRHQLRRATGDRHEEITREINRITDELRATRREPAR